ncbi:MAG: aminotransferase class V-fold PLP-dependent enzyme, partial [Bacteroidales bacterium]|nr:aminotransferase class V-fold PLP-dependent enzyme [Bacteroidales bacterium]
NYYQQEGYGEDEYCSLAEKKILERIDSPQSAVHFVSGGTQANLIVISSLLKPYESVIAAESGHIATHETGAIEATGHKINTVQTKNGKLYPKDIKAQIEYHSDEHMVKPAMVYISNTTELGTVYTKKELAELSETCKKYGLYLFMDGARLASALTSHVNDLNMSDIARLTDVFYIGGTKNGALLGEAIVINNQNLQKNFRFAMKQRGALLAKGRIFGIQFIELFKNDLFYELAQQANTMAMKLAEGIKKAGYDFLTEPASNQIFPILPNDLIEKLSKKFGFYVWATYDKNHSSIRLVTSWATKTEMVDKFIEEIKK